MEGVEGFRFGNLHIVQHHMVTAGAGQPGSLPRLLDAPVLRRQHDECGLRTLSRHHWPTVLVDHAMAADPLRVLAAAGERPAPGDAVSALDDLGPPGRSPNANGDGIGS